MKTIYVKAVPVITIMLMIVCSKGTTANAQSTGPVAKKELILDLGSSVTLKLARISGGTFMMGSPENEKDRDPKRELLHEVTISKPFYMGVTPVTVDQFAAFVKDSGYKTDAEKLGSTPGLEVSDGSPVIKPLSGGSWRKPGFEQRGDHPVVQVSWNDAQAFCAWLSKKTGKAVVLPTEAQWEYASRANTKTAYPWGDNPNDGKGWVNIADQSLKAKWFKAPADWFVNWDDGFVFTSPVGSFKANAFGLYDMNGNVSQWCQDRYGEYKKDRSVDPTGPADTDKMSGVAGTSLVVIEQGPRVIRGGAFARGTGNARSADRGTGAPDNRMPYVGMRVAVRDEN